MWLVAGNPDLGQYTSPEQEPVDFGVDEDQYMLGTLPVAAPEIIKWAEQYFIAALLPNLDGIRIARLAGEDSP